MSLSGIKNMTREDVVKRFEASKMRKREYIKQLEAEMKVEFKKRTGQEATYFEVW